MCVYRYSYHMCNSKGRTRLPKLTWGKPWPSRWNLSEGEAYTGHRFCRQETGYDKGFDALLQRGECSTQRSVAKCCLILLLLLTNQQTKRLGFEPCIAWHVTSLTKDRCLGRGFLGKFHINRKLSFSITHYDVSSHPKATAQSLKRRWGCACAGACTLFIKA